MIISRLTVENLVEGCVTDNKKPRFSFELESEKQNVILDRANIS